MASLSMKNLVASRNALKLNREILRNEAKRILMLIFGVTLVSIGFVTFQVPHNLNAGGVTGTAIIANHFFSQLSIGTVYWFINLPLIAIGFFHLGRWPFLGRTLFASTLFAVLTNFFTVALPKVYGHFPISDDLLLNAIFTAVVGGLGGGLIFNAGGTMGGTSVIGLIIHRKTGQPLSQVYYYTDGIIILLSSMIFGFEMSLYGLLMLYLYGVANDFVLEGPSNTRTVTIVTDQKDAVSQAIQQRLGRGVSYWEITGGYSNQQHYMVMCTLLRSQVNDLKTAVAEADDKAFVTIGMSHDAMGTGFKPLRGKL